MLSQVKFKKHVAAGAALIALMALQDVSAAELKPKTVAAFDRYVRLTEDRVRKEVNGEGPFLWVDSLLAPRRQQVYEQLRKGGVVVERLKTLDDGKEIQVPSGMIHHWVGVGFVSGVSPEEAARLTLDYDRHQSTYAPDVVNSKLLHQDGDFYRAHLRFLKKKVITVVLDTEHEAHYLRVDSTRSHTWSHSTHIVQVDNAGQPDERQKPEGKDGGFMWRLYTYWRFEEKDGGTYVQCESVTLTRDIPWAIGWMIRGFVESIPRESLTFTLEKTRIALAVRSEERRVGKECRL